MARKNAWEEAKELYRQITQPRIVRGVPEPPKSTVLSRLKQGKANPVAQGLFDLPLSFRETARQIPQALNQMVMNPTEFGNTARSTPQYAKFNVPGFQTLVNFAANTGQVYGTGVGNIARGYDKIQNTPGILNKAAGAAQIVKGVGQAAVPFTPGVGQFYQGANLISSLPQTQMPILNQVQRFAAGRVQGTGLDDTLAPNIQPNKSIKIKALGQDIAFDPFMTAGQITGFVNNPVNRQFFKLTEAVLPAGSLRVGNLRRWLGITALRGSIEDIFLSLDEMPENATTAQKIQFMAQNAAMGAASEVGTRGAMEGAGRLFDTKLAVRAFNELKETKRRLSIPVTGRIDPKTGKRITMPMWKAILTDQTGAITLGSDSKPLSIEQLADQARGTKPGEAAKADTSKLKALHPELEFTGKQGKSVYDEVIKPSSSNLEIKNDFEFYDSLPKEPRGSRKTVKIIGANPSPGDMIIRTPEGNFQRNSQTIYKKVPIKVLTENVAGRKRYKVVDKTGDVLDTYDGELPKEEIIKILKQKGASFISETSNDTKGSLYDIEITKGQGFRSDEVRYKRYTANIEGKQVLITWDANTKKYYPEINKNGIGEFKTLNEAKKAIQTNVAQPPVSDIKAEVKTAQSSQPRTQETIKPPVESQTLPSSPSSISKTKKYAFNINKPKLGLTGDAAKKLDKVVEEMRPILQKNKGKSLSHKEIITEGRKANLLTEVMTREETKKFTGSLLATRNLIKKQTNTKGVTPQYLEQLEILSSVAADTGRRLNSFNITAEDAGIKEQVLKDLLKIGSDAKKIVEAGKNVDWNNTKQVTEFYRKFKPASFIDRLTEYRYTNMLSSPNTHIVNAFSNFLQTGIVAPIEKTLTGSTDFVRAKLTGTEQKYFASQGVEYVKGYWKALPDAWEKFRSVLEGNDTLRKPDVDFLPTSTGKFQQIYTTPLRALEAADQFFRAMTISGEIQALKQSGITGAKAKKLAIESADYRTFRQKFDPEGKLGQGGVLKVWDKWNSAISQIRRLPGGKWIFPFLQTPTNILKQGFEYSPLGITTIPGSKEPMVQLSKTIIGTGVFIGAYSLADAGLTTFAPPTGEKEREAFYAAGLQPYAVKIGNKWVSYSKLGPLAYPFAAAAALKWAEENGMDKTKLENFGRGIAGITRFFADQSYVKNIGDIIEVTSESDPNKLIKSAQATAANLTGQVIPYRSFMGWITRMTDDTYRKGRGFSDRIKSQIPVLSKQVEAYTTPTGEESKRQFPILNSFLPAKLTEETAGKRYYDQYKSLLDLKRENTLETEKSNTQAEEIWKKMEGMTPQQRVDMLTGIKDEKVLSKIKSLAKDRASNLTPIEKKLKSAPITVRAKYVKQQMAGMTPDQKADYIIQLSEKGIITKEVRKEMLK